MNPLTDYQNALNTPLHSGSTSPMTVVTPKLAHKAIDKVKQGIQAVNNAQDFHRANLAVQEQVKQEQDFNHQQVQVKQQQDLELKQKESEQKQQEKQKTDDLIAKINDVLEGE